MGSKDQFALQVLLKDAPVTQSANPTVSITCASAWGIIPARRVGLTATEDNLYAGTSEGEISHFLLDKLSDTENVLPTSV